METEEPLISTYTLRWYGVSWIFGKPLGFIGNCVFCVWETFVFLKTFGFLFGFVKTYIVVVCLYTAAHIIYNHDKWPINLDDSYAFTWVEKGSNYLIKEFPDEKEYEDAKEKVQDI